MSTVKLMTIYQFAAMRTFIIILLFAVITPYVGAADTSDITNHVFETKDTDGKISFRSVTTYRGKERVMNEVYHPNAQGVLVVTYRSYFAGGELVMSEGGDRNSGKLDTIVVLHPGTNEIEVFTRGDDGSVRPVSTKKLEGYKKEGEVFENFIGSMNTNLSDEEISTRIQETQKKIKDIETQTTDGKQ